MAQIRFRTFIPAAFYLLVFAALPALRAQQPVEPWAAPHFSVDPKTLYQAASAVAAQDGTNAALLDEDHSYTFDEQGRIVHVAHFIYKILTEKGAEGWDQLSVGWEPWHEARPEIRVRVITPDFVEHPLDPKSITEAPARGGDYKSYSDGKRLDVPFPAIAAGVVVEEEYITRETEPLFSQGQVSEITFGLERGPVQHSRLVLDAPASLPLRTGTLLLGDMKPVRTESNGRVTLTFDVPRLEGIETRDPNLPPDFARYPEVRFSSGTSWQAMAAEYSRIVDSHADAAAVKAVVDPLIKGKSSILEKETAILDFLDREVRYTGIEFGEAAIIPHEPAEVLSKRYGDCKDKATLLVTMLRAAGIPSYVALLNAGARMDVPAELPGMGLFDHAIVYVPGANTPANPTFWIDATDRYARLGQLPIDDQGRLALITRSETTALLKTPESTSTDNTVLELRDLTLNENGPASILEKTQPAGVFESRYRSYYADKPDKDVREGLIGYVKNQYVADSLASVDRTDPADLSRPFELDLTADKVRRGYTGLDGAQAAIRLDSLFMRLPDDLRRKEETEEERKKAHPNDPPKPPRTTDWYLAEPFAAEWRYRVIPPAGFVPKELPHNQKLSIGPAVLTEEFSAGKDGVVLAHLSFDSVKRRYTVAEATELRNKVADIGNGSAILINFEPAAEALLRDGKVREALASYRGLIALHPSEAVHHLQVAKVLLDAGMGEAARQEARQAVKLDPSSALAEKILADILKHDLVGRVLRPGSDLEGAQAAFRAAARLDPDDHTADANLAILLEYDSSGRRYSRFSKMKEAIEVYRKLGQDKLSDLDLKNNLAFALFYGGDPTGAIEAAQSLNPQPTALIAASEAALHGSKAGLDEANKRSSDDAAFKESARTAGEMLMNTRHYQLAADLLQAGAAGDNAAQTMGLATMLRSAPHHEDLKFENTPTDVVKHAFLMGMDPNVTEDQIKSISSRNALVIWKIQDDDEKKKALETGKEINSQLARGNSSLDVTTDIFLEAFDPKGEGNDDIGYREKVQIPGGPSITFFVVKEGGQYKLLDSEEKPNAIGLEIVDRAKAGDLKGAKALLDWLREDSHIEGGDDPFGGPGFPRYWTKGQAADLRKITLAGASILVGYKPTAPQGIQIFEDALKTATSDHEKTNILLALSRGYGNVENLQRQFEASSELLKQEPESRTAFFQTADALMGLDRFDDAIALADQRLKQLDDDPDALRMKMVIEAHRGNIPASLAWAHKLIDLGKDSAENENEIAWFALFGGKVGDPEIAAGIKATQLAADNPHILHTLACDYAAAGKAKEAHEVLMRSMDDLNLDEPTDDYWYALGSIAEQYGERDIAIADYRKLKRPKDWMEVPTSSYRLAQNRLKALGADQAPVSAANQLPAAR